MFGNHYSTLCIYEDVCVCEVGQGFFGGLAVKNQPYLCIFKYIKKCIYSLLTDIVPYWAHKVSPLLKKKKCYMYYLLVSVSSAQNVAPQTRHWHYWDLFENLNVWVL